METPGDVLEAKKLFSLSYRFRLLQVYTLLLTKGNKWNRNVDSQGTNHVQPIARGHWQTLDPYLVSKYPKVKSKMSV